MPEDAGIPRSAADLAQIREETRFELDLLHGRVNALVGAEAFLTIAYTAAMSNGAKWGGTFSALVSPILSVLGLLLALLAWPGVFATVKVILAWTDLGLAVLAADPSLSKTVWGRGVHSRGARTKADQRGSLLFFRAAPGLFVLVWSALTVIAVILPR